MKVVMLVTNSFDPDVRVYKEAMTLASAGLEVEVLCWDRESKCSKRDIEFVDGFIVRRFYASSRYGTGLRQIPAYLSFSSAVCAHLRNIDYQVLHCHDLDAALIGILIRKPRTRVIFDEHDLFSLYFRNRRGWFSRNVVGWMVECLESVVVKIVDRHIVTTRAFKEFRGPSERITVITNAPLDGYFENTTKSNCAVLRVGYVGGLNYLEELQLLLDAASDLLGVRVLVSGGGRHFVLLRDKYSNIENITFTGPYAPESVAKPYSEVDVSYAFYHTDTGLYALPNKFFESMMSGTPVIVNALSEAAKFVVEEGTGYLLSEGTVMALRELLKRIAHDRQELIAKANNVGRVRNDYTWQVNAERLLEMYRGLAV